VTGQLRHGQPVDISLELDDRIEGNEEVMPAPGVELGLDLAGFKLDVTVFAQHSQQEPNLLLPPVEPAPLSANPATGDVVVEPVCGASENLNVVGQKTSLLL